MASRRSSVASHASQTRRALIDSGVSESRAHKIVGDLLRAKPPAESSGGRRWSSGADPRGGGRSGGGRGGRGGRSGGGYYR